MNAMWQRVVIGGVGVLMFLGLGAMGIANNGWPRAELPIVEASDAADEKTPSWQAFLITQGNLLNLEIGPPADRR